MNNEKFKINAILAHRLMVAQFPQWKDLPVMPVVVGGWDNRTFHLGKDMLIRMPSSMEYADKVDKEQKWLPKLAPLLPLEIPKPLAMGRPSADYPCEWPIYRWIEGETVAFTPVHDIEDLAVRLAKFVIALQQINIPEGPLPKFGDFSYIGGLSAYDNETRRAIVALQGKIDAEAATTLWEKTLTTRWQLKPVWVHGDISAANLLMQNGKLKAVIDFGGLSVGDPACDLVITWKFFQGKSRDVFRQTLSLDKDTWTRAGAWALWKALIVWAGFVETNIVESNVARRTVQEVLEDYKHLKI